MPHIRFDLAAHVGDTEHTTFAAVAIEPDAAVGLDTHDAFALEPASGADGVRLAFKVPGSDDGASGLSVSAVPGEAEIDLHIGAFASGEPAGVMARLNWSAVEMGGWSAILLDRLTGQEYSLDEDGEIALNVAQSAAFMPLRASTVSAKRSASGGLPTAKPLRLSRHEASRFAVSLKWLNTSGEDVGVRVLELGAPVPNPTRGAIRIPLSLDVAQTAEVAVYDALGRRVAVLADGPLAAGAHDLTMDTSPLAPGLYIVRLNTEETTMTQRFTVIR